MISSSAQRSAALACVVVALAVAAMLAGCGSGGTASSRRQASSTASRPAPARAGRNTAGHAMTGTLPARIDRRPQGFISSEAVWPLVNAWRTADRHGFIEVDAGALSYDRSIGVFAIFRHDFTGVDQSADLVKVLGSGPLRITDAPQGNRVETAAQHDGRIDFTGARGVRGTLSLRDDSVSLQPPGAAPQR
jgi:hypothetical protein